MSDWKASASSDGHLSSVHDEPVEEIREKEDVDLNKKSTVAHEPVQLLSKKGAIDPFGEPPNGGLNAWLKVLGCFLIYSNIW